MVKWILRKLRLMQLADYGRFLIQKWKMHAKNRDFVAQNPDVVLPPNYLLYESFQLDYARYYVNGRKTAEWLTELILPYLHDGRIKVLDWGCGPARVVRHLPDLLANGSQICATDYNKKSIAWCASSLPDVQFSVNDLMPPLDYPDSSFDLVYGISIFTHLSEPAHTAWMNELQRILVPGGILFQTLHGEVFRAKLTQSEKQSFSRGELVTRGQVKEGHRTYVAFHPELFVRNWTQSLELVKHLPGSEQNGTPEQDVWVWRKP